MRKGWLLSVVCFTVLLCSTGLAAPVPEAESAVKPPVEKVEDQTQKVNTVGDNGGQEIKEEAQEDAPVITMSTTMEAKPNTIKKGLLADELIDLMVGSNKIPEDFNWDQLTQDHIKYYIERDGDHHIHVRLPKESLVGLKVVFEKETEAPSEDGAVVTVPADTNIITDENNDVDAGVDANTGKGKDADEVTPKETGKTKASQKIVGWMKNADGTLNWLTIMVLVFFLFI